MRIVRLNKEQALSVWPQMIQVFSSCFTRHPQIHTLDDIKEKILNEEMQLWCVFNKMVIIGGIITSVDSASNGRKLSVIELAGRNLKLWASVMDDELTSFAKANNCGSIEALTRKGFSKYIPSFKIQRNHVLHVKRVE